VHHFTVHRGAQYARITAVAQKSGLAALFLDPGNGNLLQIHGRHTRLDTAAQHFQNLSSRDARTAHLLDFLGRLQYNCHRTQLSAGS